MAVVLKPKRGTSTPDTNDIVSGEIAIDTSAKKLYINDAGTVKEIGGATGEAGMYRYQYVATSGQETFTGSDANSEVLSYAVGGLLVFLNGVYLQGYNDVDYVASNGTSVVLEVGAATNDVLDIVAIKNSNTALSGMNRYQYVATSGQETFTGSDANGNNLAYVSGNLFVFLNGVYLQGYNNVDYTASNGTSVVLEVGATTGDVIDIVSVHTSQSQLGPILEATEFTTSANNSTDETVYPVFVDGTTGAQGAETDTGLTYNPSTGVLTTTSVTGNLTGNVTGNVSGTAGSATGNAATATALANARTIGGTSFDGTGNIAVGLAATATTLANARTIHGVSFDGSANIDLSEEVADTVGAMFSSNTETGITATYQDADNTIDLVVGTLNQDTTGNAATATALANERTIGGVAFDGTADINLPGVNTAGNQNTTGTAAIATAVTITDNENTNENNALIFTAGGDLDGGNLGLESDGDLHYNPSTGLLTATSFAGALTGNVTGNVSGSAGSATGNAATATALANTRTIAGQNFDGTGNITIASTDLSNTSDIVLLTGAQTLASKTLTSPVLNTGVSGTAIKDEDNMASNSATHIATQQSVKAYVDTQVATAASVDDATALAIALG